MGLKVSLDFSALRAMRWQQYALRFALGGAVTLAAGLLAKAFGPELGGLFLAFPAIFPASATLIAKREQQKKARQGLHGGRRGKEAAALDAAGATLGAFALICFAVGVWRGLPVWSAPIVLASAAMGWLLIAVSLWWLRKKLRLPTQSAF